MDYKKEINSAIKRATENLSADRKARDEAEANYKKRESEEEIPIKALIREYLDHELKDADGTSVGIGYVIAHKKGWPTYKVRDRGMQFILGVPMSNPSVQVVKYDTEQEQQDFGRRIKTLYKRDLAEMVIVETI